MNATTATATNQDQAYALHAKAALRMLNFSVNLRNGAFARSIYAIYLAMVDDVVSPAEVRPYVTDPSLSKEARTATINAVLDNVFGYYHVKGDPNENKAPSKVRQMVTLSLPSAYYLWYRHSLADAEMVNGVATKPAPELILTSAGKINEKATLHLPGPWFYADEDTAEAAWTKGVTLDGTGTGTKARTVERLAAIAKAALQPATTGATEQDDPTKKVYNKLPFATRADLLTADLETMVRQKPDILAKDGMRESLDNLRTALFRAALPGTMTEDEKGLVQEADDMVEVVGSLELYKNNKPLMARLKRLYDALEEASKNAELWQALEDADTVQPAVNAAA